MKLAVIGNCQGESIAACLGDMNSDVKAQFHMISDLWGGGKTLNDILNEYEVVVAQPSIRQYVPEQQANKVFYFPDVTFPAFHPDMTYLRGKKKGGEVETIHSHMAHYNSALVVYGYTRRMTPERIIALFNQRVYGQLGYLDRWEAAEAMLLAQGDAIGMSLKSHLDKWKGLGCFMHSFNHPTLVVLNDIAVLLARRIGIEVRRANSFRYLDDPLRGTPIWPVYPEIASRYGLEGDYAFRRFSAQDIMYLEEFVKSSVAQYAKFDMDSIEPLNFDLTEFDKALAATRTVILPGAADTNAAGGGKPDVGVSRGGANPYKNLPDVQFWKKSVATVNPSDVDPVYQPRFTIDQNMKVATAGSCFAQHIARTLSKSGFNYFVSESPPVAMSADEAHLRNYGVFSARYGNVYTARQLVQLFHRTSGNFVPHDNHWQNGSGRYVDPFRPQIEPDGFESVAALESSRRAHFDAVSKVISESEVFVFTLGLTEGWRSKLDGAVFPLAPGVAGGEMDPSKYEFVNFSVDEIVADMTEALLMLRQKNQSNCKIVLTVSPVPLIATYEPQHVLVATTYSKSVLRVAAAELKRMHDFVEYFPSYEIITGAFNRGAYFEDDLRSVKPEGVDHVMRLFMKHYAGENQQNQKSENFVPHMKNMFDIVCDEEAIAKF